MISLILVSGFAVASHDSSANSEDNNSNYFVKFWHFLTGVFGGSGVTGRVAFTPAQCDAIFPAPGMLSYWSFDDGDGADNYEAHDAVIFEAISVDGLVGKAFEFDGVDDSMTVVNDADFRFDHTTGDDRFTISAWVFPTSITGEHTIVSWVENGGVSAFYKLRTVGNQFELRLESANTLVSVQDAFGTVQLNQWQHVAVTLVTGSGGPATWEYYVDGVDVGGRARRNFRYSAIDGTLRIGIDANTIIRISRIRST